MAFGIYVHIPFCQRKCSYCDFLSVDKWDESLVNDYIERLQAEIAYQSGQAYWQRQDPVTSIFFGGGTPTIAPVEGLVQLLGSLQRSFEWDKEVEITIEANPGTVQAESLAQLREAGFNRISFGVQSFVEAELRTCSRIHRTEEAITCLKLAQQTGWDNINLDLMYGLPGQSLASWESSLRQAVELAPQHISAYSLIVEEATPIAVALAQGHLRVPEEAVELAQGRLAQKLLAQYGYEHYEISNYAQPGYRCRHNLLYWQRQPYLGLGLGAAGFDGLNRYENTDSWRRYLKADLDTLCNKEVLSREAAMSEFVFLGLRQCDGISGQEFLSTFGKSIWEVFGSQLEKWLEHECLLVEKDNIKLSDYGREISNSIFVDFIK